MHGGIAAAVGLDDDDRQCVRHHVVHVTCDARAFGGGRDELLLLLACANRRVAFVEQCDRLVTRALPEPGHGREHEHDRDEHEQHKAGIGEASIRHARRAHGVAVHFGVFEAPVVAPQQVVHRGHAHRPVIGARELPHGEHKRSQHVEHHGGHEIASHLRARAIHEPGIQHDRRHEIGHEHAGADDQLRYHDHEEPPHGDGGADAVQDVRQRQRHGPRLVPQRHPTVRHTHKRVLRVHETGAEQRPDAAQQRGDEAIDCKPPVPAVPLPNALQQRGGMWCMRGSGGVLRHASHPSAYRAQRNSTVG